MRASIHYLNAKHEFAKLGVHRQLKDETHKPDPPEQFLANQKELARDMVAKAKEIELLISSLPGFDQSEEQQLDRIRALDTQLREVEKRRQKTRQEKEQVTIQLEDMITQIAAKIQTI